MFIYISSSIHLRQRQKIESIPQLHRVLGLIISILEKTPLTNKQASKRTFPPSTHFRATYRLIPGDLLEDDVVGRRPTGLPVGCHVICPRQRLPPRDARRGAEGWGKVKSSLDVKSSTSWASDLFVRCCASIRHPPTCLRSHVIKHGLCLLCTAPQCTTSEQLCFHFHR